MNSEEATKFLKAWDQGQEEFTVQSSGSTGIAKTITLQRKWMEWSAAQTAKYIHARKGDKMICCLPVNKVGGMMMLVRARVWGTDFQVMEAKANPLIEVMQGDIISLTPYQIFHILSDPASTGRLENFREILIGGSEIPLSIENQLRHFGAHCKIRHSYGMSETYSHIALRMVNGPDKSEWFRPFEEVKIAIDKNDTTRIFTPFYPEGLLCNDLVEVEQNLGFKVLGRKDFIINSGGVKIQPELLESLIFNKLNPLNRFVISSRSDEELGEKLILVCENMHDFQNRDLGFLKEINLYAVPKEIIEIKAFPYNEGYKTDRNQIRKLISK